jgi:hypothetical protein
MFARNGKFAELIPLLSGLDSIPSTQPPYRAAFLCPLRRLSHGQV